MSTNTAPAETLAPGVLNPGVFNPAIQPEPEEPLLKGLIYKGDLIPWIGREKERKSNLVLQCVICMAIGRNFLSFPHGTGKPVRVVYLDYESRPTSLHTRYKAICDAMKLSEEERTLLGKNLKIILVRMLQRKHIEVRRFPVKAATTTSKPEERKDDAWWKRFALQHPAEVYVFDPMRSLHAQDENNSSIEMLLSRLREMFPNATIIIPHHMNLASRQPKGEGAGPVTLSTPGSVREFAQGARGSTAINAHADAIIVQERRMQSDVETVYLGAYMKDAADVESIALTESQHNSFFWITSENVPARLRSSFESLKREILGGPGRVFQNEAEAARALMTADRGKPMSLATAYRRVKDLKDAGFLQVAEDGSLRIKATSGGGGGSNATTGPSETLTKSIESLPRPERKKKETLEAIDNLQAIDNAGLGVF